MNPIGCRRAVRRRFSFTLALAACAPVLRAGIAAAVLIEAGTEFRVNTFTISAQRRPQVSGDGAGAFVVVWDSLDQDGDVYGVFGQRFDSTGTATGTEFQVNTFTTSGQRHQHVSLGASGAFVVVWQTPFEDGDQLGVFGQRFDSSGAAAGAEFQANTYTTARQSLARVRVDSGGAFLVVWRSDGQDGSLGGIFGQRYDSGGAPVSAEFQVNSYTTGSQDYADISSDGGGGFVIVWDSYSQDGDGDGVFGQRYDSAGAAVGTEFQINIYTPTHQTQPRVSPDGAGFAAVWRSLPNQDGSAYGVFGQRFDSTGARAGTEFQVSTYTTGSQDMPAVSADGSSGGFVVAWQSALQDGALQGTFAQRYDSAGARTGTEFLVNTFTSSLEEFPDVAATADGFVVAWEGISQDHINFGIVAQRYRDLAPLCAAAPLGTCRTPGASQLVLRNRATDRADKVLWRWLRGAATGFPEFGTPTAAANYALCVYHNGTLLMEVDAPAGINCKSLPCWTVLGAPGNEIGYRYRDLLSTPNGMRQVRLKASLAGSARVIVKGAGVPLPDPPLGLTAPVTVELVNSETSVCWGDTYSGSEIEQNSSARFAARATN